MPMLKIHTNQTRCHVPKDFHKTTTEMIAKLLEKPAERCCVMVVTDLNMSRGGSTDPCGFAELISIGQIDEERNKSYVHTITTHIEKFLSISRKRLLIRFIDEKPENLGICGTTYKELLQEYKPKKKKKHESSSESGSSDSESDDDKKKKGKKGKNGRKESVDSKGKKKGSVSSGKSTQSKESDKAKPADGDKAEGGEGAEGEPAEGAPAGGAPAEGAPAEGAPAGEAPAGGAEGGEGNEGGEEKPAE